MTDRERLIELISNADTYDKYNCELCDKGDDACRGCYAERLTDYLFDNGVVVTPCVAMVEQFLKDGKFDNKITAHNGKYAVVYLDKSKWNSPLIDITEHVYNADKATERLKELEGAEK